MSSPRIHHRRGDEFKARNRNKQIRAQFGCLKPGMLNPLQPKNSNLSNILFLDEANTKGSKLEKGTRAWRSRILGPEVLPQYGSIQPGQIGRHLCPERDAQNHHSRRGQSGQLWNFFSALLCWPSPQREWQNKTTQIHEPKTKAIWLALSWPQYTDSVWVVTLCGLSIQCTYISTYLLDINIYIYMCTLSLYMYGYIWAANGHGRNTLWTVIMHSDLSSCWLGFAANHCSICPSQHIFTYVMWWW